MPTRRNPTPRHPTARTHGDRGSGLLRQDDPVAAHRVPLSVAKKAAARLSRSRSWRSRAFSRRNRTSSARSSVVSPSSRSWRSGWSWRRQLRNVCSETPRLSANSRGERPARNSSTAWRRNFGGEAGRVLGTTDTILSRPDGASHQTSAKPGPLHRAASRYCGLVCGGERGARMAASSSTANAGAKTSNSMQAQ